MSDPKPRKPRRQPARTPSGDAPLPTRRGRLEILFEDMRSDNRAVMEAVTSFEGRLSARIDDTNRRMDENFAVLGAAVRQNSTDIRELTGRMDRVETKLDQVDGRLERVEGRLDRVEGRLDRVESKLEQVDGRLDRVEVLVEDNGRRLNRIEGKLDNKVGREEFDALAGRVSALERSRH